ncbi:MAG: hypothetical protein KAS32_15715 [Candidatus Peribacteraceae bacterium]|nr:hypothetical protein [Candidatus Peribacteraceae bacterium]
MTILDAVEPNDLDVPEVAFMCGEISHEEYKKFKEIESYKIIDGRVQ